MDHVIKEKSTSWKAGRRKRAWTLCQAGWAQKDIAEALGVTKGAISQWLKRGREVGSRRRICALSG